MNKTLIIGAGIATVLVIGAIVIGSTIIGMYNTSARDRNTYEAKVKSNEGEFDNMKKKIREVVQVPDMQFDKLKELFVAYADARTSENAGSMMLWVKESVPNVDTKTFDNLMNIIVASRDGWTMRQNELVEIARVYNERLSVFPGNFLLPIFGFQKIDAKVISSTETKQAFQTGVDDNVDIYKKK